MQVSERAPIKLVIVEVEELQRDLLRMVLSAAPGLEVVGVFADGQAAIDVVSGLRPHVAVLDLELTKPSAVHLALKLRRLLPDIGVVLVSSAHDIEVLSTLSENALFGWCYQVNRSTHTVNTLLKAIQVTAARLVDLPVVAHSSPRLPYNAVVDLTERQREILDLVARGMSNRAVARFLQLKERTIENQLASIYQKLDIRRGDNSFHPRVQAVLRYLELSSR